MTIWARRYLNRFYISLRKYLADLILKNEVPFGWKFQQVKPSTLPFSLSHCLKNSIFAFISLFATIKLESCTTHVKSYSVDVFPHISSSDWEYRVRVCGIPGSALQCALHQVPQQNSKSHWKFKVHHDFFVCLFVFWQFCCCLESWQASNYVLIFLLFKNLC